MKQQILSTKNYSQFTECSFNRRLNKANVQAFKNEIQKMNLLPDNPITVVEFKGSQIIIDGHHRFQACKELQIPVWYKVSCFKPKNDKELISMMRALNGSAGKKHSFSDLLNSAILAKNHTAIRIDKLQKEYAPEISLHQVACLLFSFQTGGGAQRAFLNGNFKIKHEVKFIQLMQSLRKFDLPVNFINSKIFHITSVLNLYKDKVEVFEFIKRLKQNESLLKSNTKRELAMANIVKTYNYRLQKTTILPISRLEARI